MHLLVPAEHLIATAFSGYAVRVAGSSYAAARVSAWAACFQAAHPQWRAAQLKAAIFDLAVQPVHASTAYVAVGVLPEPTSMQRGACAAVPLCRIALRAWVDCNSIPHQSIRRFEVL